MKNGNYNEIEEILQKRFKGVKDDIKDPGFINIEYKEKEKKESFFKKPAVYAAGLVLVAVLVCGGTFAGLKIMEKIGAERLNDPITSVSETDVPETEDPIKMSVSSGGKTIYPTAYLGTVSGYDPENGGYFDGIGPGAASAESVPKIRFDTEIFVSYDKDASLSGYFITGENGDDYYIKEQTDKDDTLSGYLLRIVPGVYRVKAIFSVRDGQLHSDWECPFDVEILQKETTETDAETETVTETETETDIITETETTAETTDITPPGTYREGKPPVYLKVFDANEIIYPDAYESYGLWGTEGAKNVPVLHYDGSDIDIAYVQPSGRCYVGYRLYGVDEEEHISVDYINDYLKHAHTGNYRFIVNFSIETGDEITGYGYPFDVEVLRKEVTTGPEETTGPDLHDPETPDLTVKVTCGAKTIIPDAYAAYGGGVDEDNAYMSNKVPYITYVNDGLKVDYDERNIANVSYWIAFSDKKSWTLDEVNDYLKDAVEGEYRIVIRIKRETHDEYGNFINSTHDYPFDVIVTTPAEPIEPDMTNGKHPVYLTVKCGNQTIYPDAYFLWTTEYRDEEGGWLEGDGAGAVWAENVPVIEFDGGAAIKIGYKEAGNGTSLSFRINKGEEYWNVSRDEINSFFKHAELGTYRITVTCSVKGRLIDGQYESTGWEYPFDVVVK